MTDGEKREKVINGLETVVDQMECEVAEWVNYTDSELNNGLTVDCDWWSGALGKLEDALELLKAQEPVEPKKNDVEFAGLRTWDWACPECNCILIYRANYCSCCGRAVKWE
jgi:hypothetical protein